MGKLTDEQIIKAFELCINLDLDNCPTCCYFDSSEENEWCSEKLFASVLDLINRQKARYEYETERLSHYMKMLDYSIEERNKLRAEIKKLNALYNDAQNNCFGSLTLIHRLKNKAHNAKCDGIKEFWSRLKEISYLPNLSITGEYVIDVSDGDNLVKEMVGDNE